MKALLTASSYSGVGGNIIDSSIGLEHGNKGGTKVPFCGENIVKSSYPNIILIEEDEHELAKEDMTKVRDENTKLKRMLEQLGRDYQSLHKRFIDIKQPQQFNKTIAQQEDHDREERELLSLRLGRNHSKPQRDNQVAQTRDDNNLQLLNNEGLYLASDDSNENSSVVETGKEDEGDQAGEISPPYKLLKTMRSSGNDEEATLQQPVTKRARVSVRAKCDSSTINDGCQWRKYGQKTAKGNPCPRAYYRCTIAPGCPVKKQVQRCMHDMAILTTTYEGTHNHPLPASATSMASTTSAAASMLLSGSSTSAMSPSFFQGQNFGIDNTNLSPTSQFYLPNTSPQAFSTITLDLTTSRFSSSRTNNLPSVWGNGYLNNVAMPYDKTTLIPQFFPLPNSEKSKQESSQQILTETLTRAITSDPSLRSVINAAISSMVINSGENKNNSQQAPLQFSI